MSEGRDTPPAHDPRTLLTKGEDTIDPTTWAGSLPAAYGIAPRVRVGAKRWLSVVWLIPIGLVLLLAAVAAAKGLRANPIEQMTNQLSMLAYDMNGRAPAVAQRGSARFQAGEVDRRHRARGGYLGHRRRSGGYNADHEFFGYRQSI